MSRFTLHRRALLKGVLGGVAASLALPPLEAMLNSTGEALANGTALDTVVGLWFFGNGGPVMRDAANNYQLFSDTLGQGAGFTIPTNSILSPFVTPSAGDPLGSVKSHLTVVSNCAIKGWFTGLAHSAQMK